jgi:hypothetical protein
MKTINYYFKQMLLLSATVVLFTHIADGQSFADSLMRDEQDIIMAIAPYSPDMRSAILDVAQYPQILVKLERIQARSSQSFQDMIAQYPQSEQEKFYQLSRFPDLIHQIVGTGQKMSDIKPLLKDYPPKIQDQIVDVYNTHFKEVVQIHNLYQSSQTALEKVIANYPKNVQDDFQKIIAMPDVMTLLTDN